MRETVDVLACVRELEPGCPRELLLVVRWGTVEGIGTDGRFAGEAGVIASWRPESRTQREPPPTRTKRFSLLPRGKLKSMSFTRITVRADQMGGVPCIRGLRIPIATVVGMVADGMSGPEILAAYPDLEAEDVREAMRYAAEAVRERELPLAAAG